MPIRVAPRSKAWACGRSLAGIADSIPAGAWISVSCECCVLSGRGVFDGPIIRPEESYQFVVFECDLENPTVSATYALVGL